ncbi:PQQ-binding-like beta-propeller repeat protein [Streptomyces sp. NPDC091204]|uniref:PQQ-binding-like beta-propeller repeat protein n=1 Tax=Streptomyces sp. NPDC091204 TaxID=3155299 RepID=UPI0034484181
MGPSRLPLLSAGPAAGSAAPTSPAVVNSTVYFGSYDGKVYALDAATGQAGTS